MKYIIYPLFFLTVFSCKKEGCTDPTASNYDPDAGKSCASCCDYPQTNTTTPPADPRDAYVGNYWVTQVRESFGQPPTTTNYTLVVTKDTVSSTAIVLDNMFGGTESYTAEMSGENWSFTAPDFPNESASGNFTNDSVYYTGQYDIFSYTGEGEK